MLGTRLQFGNVRGEDRFYIAGKSRKRYNQQPKQTRKAKNDANQSPKESKVVVSENKGTESSLTKPCSDPSLTPKSNLDRFLESTTPSVPAQYLSKTTMRGLRTCDVEFRPYFTLNDLWESFREWSAYGAGVPLVLNKSDSVIQYYVPYLSGIQLFGGTAVKSSAKLRQGGEDNDVDYYLDSSSDASSDCETEKHMKATREQQHILHRLNNEVSSRMGRLSVHDEHPVLQEGFSSDDGEAGNSQGLLFEYLERDAPYCREPLADKISDLARKYPRLKSLRSCDLLRGSWISVAWYPIYRIPTGPTLKDLDACFLTYHSLSTPMTGGGGNDQDPVIVYPSQMVGVSQISLRIFGLASYKLKGSLWAQNGIDCQLADSLMQAADNWLTLLQVNHPDFQFFASHGMYCR